VKRRSENHSGEKEESADTFDLIERLLANPLYVEGFEPFTREEIYDQR
jgi:hypothetical protein